MVRGCTFYGRASSKVQENRNSAPVSIIRRAPPTSASYFLISPHRKRTKPSPSSTAPVDPSEAHPRITARSERAHLHHPIGDAPGRVPRSTRGCTVTPDSEGQPYAERLRGGLFQDGECRLNSHHSPINRKSGRDHHWFRRHFAPGWRLRASHGRGDEERAAKARAFAPSSFGRRRNRTREFHRVRTEFTGKNPCFPGFSCSKIDVDGKGFLIYFLIEGMPSWLRSEPPPPQR